MLHFTSFKVGFIISMNLDIKTLLNLCCKDKNIIIEKSGFLPKLFSVLVFPNVDYNYLIFNNFLKKKINIDF